MRIGFIGDTILSDEASIAPELVNILQGTDFNIANLEAPYVLTNAKPRKSAGLHQLTHSVALLTQLNIKAVSLANNHMMDFDGNAIVNTINHLKNNGIGCFGAGNNSHEALLPFEIETSDGTFRFFGTMQRYHSAHHFATQSHGGIAQYVPSQLKRATAQSPKDKNVLFVHWNQEFEDFPEPESKSSAEKLTDCFGMIVGSHPHCIQGISKINNSVIAYSLGNFVLPHRTYCNTTLKRYPDKSYTAFILIWNTEDKDNPFEVIPYTITKDGLHIESIEQEASLHMIQHLKTISETLHLKGKAYYQFYKQHRIRKHRPMLTHNEIINRIVIGSYMSGRAALLKSEIMIARTLDAMGLRRFFKQMLAKIIKRYH